MPRSVGTRREIPGLLSLGRFRFTTFCHGPCPCGSCSYLFRDFLGLFRFEVHGYLHAIALDVNTDHSQAGWPDLEIRRYVTFLIDSHTPRSSAMISGVSPRPEALQACALDGSFISDLDASMQIDPNKVVLRDLRPGDASWLIQRHAELYAESDGFDSSFEAFVADIMSDFIRNHDPAVERFWIAETDGYRIRSICCAKSDKPDVARLRLFLVEPEARGLGLGHRLLKLCLSHATDAGFRKMELWTFASLNAACALYSKHGFICIDAMESDFFGKRRIEQIWERPLD